MERFKRRTTEFVPRFCDNGRPMRLTWNGRPEGAVLAARSSPKLLDQLRHDQTQLRLPASEQRPTGVATAGVVQPRRA
jgi:hypothetical protein